MKPNAIGTAILMTLSLTACESEHVDAAQAADIAPLHDFDPTARFDPPSIRAMQEYLNAMSIRDKRGDILIEDGRWKSETSEAVVNFQRLHGLPPTGAADPLTVAAIGVGIRTARLLAPSRFPSRLTPEDALANSPPANQWAGKVNAKLDRSGNLAVQAGDYKLLLSTSSCREEYEALKTCNHNSTLRLIRTNSDFDQTITVNQINVNREFTLFRGTLDDKFDARPSTPTFILSDVDDDGEDDLIVWTGNEGAYGGPSFSVFLFDAKTDSMVYSTELSDLTVGSTGLFKASKGTIKTSSRDGCCLYVFDTYEIAAKKTKLIERVIEDTSALDPKVTVEKLIDGELKKISQNRLYLEGADHE